MFRQVKQKFGPAMDSESSPSEMDNPTSTSSTSTKSGASSFPGGDHHSPETQSCSTTTSSKEGVGDDKTQNFRQHTRTQSPQPRLQQFFIPNEILRNLTPIKSRDSSSASSSTLTSSSSSSASSPIDPIKRKQDHLKSIQIRLKIRSSMISNRIEDVKQQRQRSSSIRSQKLVQRHLESRRRRMEYLNMVRERARRVVMARMREGTSVDINNNDDEEKTRKRRAIGGVRTEFEDRPIGCNKFYECEEMVEFQRICRKYLLMKYLDVLRESQFLNHFEGYSFNRVISIVNDSNHEIPKSIYFILKHLGVPNLVDCEYRSFMYCFIMINDFNDCMKGANQYNHPASNSNVNGHDERSIFFNNCIWLVVYKYTILLIEEFKFVVNAGRLTTKFNRYWEQYRFYFKIFKWNHYLNIKEILRNSIDGLTSQLQFLLEDNLISDQLAMQRLKLSNELSLLNSYSVFGLRQFISTDRVTQFMSNLNQLIFDDKNVIEYNIVNSFRFIKFNSIRFCLPYVPIDDWRKYWFNRYFEEHVSNKKVPHIIKAGYIESTNRKRYIDVNEVSDHVESSIQNLYDQFYQYYCEFGNRRGVTKDSIANDEDIWKSLENLINYFEPYNRALLDLVKNHGDDNRDTLAQLSIIVNNYWINKTKYENFRHYQQFENVYVLINTEHFPKLNFNWYTFNPQLLFPKLYKMIIDITREDTYLVNENVVNTSFKNSLLRVLIDCPDCENNGKFFINLFSKMIIQGKVEVNELNIIYQSRLRQLHEDLSSLIKVNAFVLMYLNYYQGEVKNNINDVISTGRIHLNDYDAQFVLYYKNSHDRIISILQEKLVTAISVDGIDYEVVLRNFRYCSDQLINVITDMVSFNKFIYKLYNPILNWIYMDIKL